MLHWMQPYPCNCKEAMFLMSYYVIRFINKLDVQSLNQVRENPSGNFREMYRHINKGAWTFSMQDHGWQVSDCTAEGLKVLETSHIFYHTHYSLISWTHPKINDSLNFPFMVDFSTKHSYSSLFQYYLCLNSSCLQGTIYYLVSSGMT